MSVEPIIESGMSFGPYPEGHCFRVENSKIHQKLKQNVKIAEFLLLRLKNTQPPTVWIIEAKSSAPRPESPNFSKFIGEIREKLINTLTVAVAACLNRHELAETELPRPFQALNLKTTDFKLVLVINGHQDAWLVSLEDALKKALRDTVKTWALSPNAVAVINDKMARKRGLIQ